MTELEKIIDKIDLQYIELNDGKRFVITGAERYFYKEQLTVYTMRAFGDGCFYDYSRYFNTINKELDNITSSSKLHEMLIKWATEDNIVAIKLSNLTPETINEKLKYNTIQIRKLNEIDENLKIIDELCTNKVKND